MLDNIKIIQINEDDLQIPESPNGWMEWSSWIKFLCSDHIDIVFTSQIEYLPYINKYFPDSSCRILSKEINISATEIRKNIYKYWEFLPKSVKSYYTYRVCFVGTESCGKSTISNMIAHKFNYGIVNEFGREFVNTKYNGDESKLTTKDFIEIGDIQSLRIRESSENSNGISIIDTDLYITQFYHKLYFNIENYPLAITIKEHELHFPVDLYIYLSDDVEWVSDGLRMNGTKEQRLNTKKLLWDTLPTNVNILTVNGTSYEDRYNNVERVFERIIKDINAR
jgi:HTH-type transcriptional repressor of NAD biosynthesis genes